MNGFFSVLRGYISIIAIIGDIEPSSEILKAFEKDVSNTDLISEQINPDSVEYSGSRQQAFSYIGLVMSAYHLGRYGKKGGNGVLSEILRLQHKLHFAVKKVISKKNSDLIINTCFYLLM